MDTTLPEHPELPLPRSQQEEYIRARDVALMALCAIMPLDLAERTLIQLEYDVLGISPDAH